MENRVKASGIRIAVVDMEPYYTENLRDYAALHTGVELCDVYPTAGELLTALEAGISYDAVVSEAFLPDITATTFLQRLDALNLIKRPMVLMMTDPENLRRASALLNAGADQIIRKPDSIQELLDHLLAMESDAGKYLENRVRERIWWGLHELHLYSVDNGYDYLAEAIFIQTMADHTLCIKELYPMVVQKFGLEKGDKRMESAIRRLLDADLNRDCKIFRLILQQGKLPKETEHISPMKFIDSMAQVIRSEIGPRPWLTRQQSEAAQ